MARGSTLNVSLTSSLKHYIDAKVRAGGYESASEVIRDSLRALQERDRIQEEFWAGVRRKVAVGKQQARERKVVDGEAAMREIIGDLGRNHSGRSRGRAKA